MTPTSHLAALRALVESIERHAPEGGLRPSAHAQRRRGQSEAEAQAWGRALSFGLPALDQRFRCAGLPFGAHELCGPRGEAASALLFAVLLLARRLHADPKAQALVVQEPGALVEGGGLYGPGLWALGLDPGRLVLVNAHEGRDALRITDDAVRSGAVAAVLTEAPRAAQRLDLAATQRLNLYGRQTRTLALLIVPDLETTSAAMTRWRIAPAPSQAPRAFLGPPALALELARNRLGPTGRLTVDWSSDDAAFRLAAPAPGATLRPPLAAAAAHRPALSSGGALDAPGHGAPGKERAAAGGGR